MHQTSKLTDNPGEDTDGNTYGAEDTVYAIITGETTVNEGGVLHIQLN